MKRRQFIASGAASAGLLSLGPMAPRVARAASLPGWVSSLPLWQWYAIPNTELSRIDPTPRPTGGTGPASKIIAWCGATLKRSGSVYMLGAAGGHGDYTGNEVNALALNAETPTWVQLRGPTPNEYVIGNSTQFYLDYRPAAAHTYYATQFINSMNRMIVMPSEGPFGIGAAPPAGWPYMGRTLVYSFNMTTGDWDRPDSPTYFKPFPGSGDETACLCAKHPVTEDIYYSRNSSTSGWYRFSATANTWTKLSNESRSTWYAGAAIDPNRNRVLVFGGYDRNGPEVRDLNGMPVSVSFGGLGASALAVSGYPGALYDEANGNFLCFFNANGVIEVRRVDPATWKIDTPTISGAAPAARQNGLQNAAQYVPELGGFVLANRHNGNVYFVRTSLNGQTVPPPDVTAPAAPTGLSIS